MKQHEYNTENHNHSDGRSGDDDDPVSAFSDFPSGQTHTRIHTDSGKNPPSAALGMLAVYSFKDVSFTGGSHGLPEMISLILIVILHYRKRNMLLSIAAGTICYMLLVRLVF